MKLVIASTLSARMAGLLFRRDLATDEVLVLVPCHDIHTVGMRAAIDVAFLDSHGVVCKAVLNLPPGRRVACRDACTVLERFSSAQDDRGTIRTTSGSAAPQGCCDWFHEGDRIDIHIDGKECV